MDGWTIAETLGPDMGYHSWVPSLSYILHLSILYCVYDITPPSTEVGMGYTGFTRCLSVRLSVDKVSETFEKIIGSIHFY